MRYLITGGCGFVGANLSLGVLRRGGVLTVFDNLSRVGADVNLAAIRGVGRFEFVHGDIRCHDDVVAVVKRCKPDVVFHLAGQVAMTSSVEKPFTDFQINANGTLNLLEAIRNHAPRVPVLYSSTNKVYGDLERLDYRETETRYVCDQYPFGFNEELPLDFSTPYGCSKGSADQYVRDYYRMFDVPTVVFRHSSMFGGLQHATFDQGWIGWFTQQVLELKHNPSHDFTVAGTGKQVRDVLHADDIVDLYFRTIDSMDAARGQIFNVGGGMDNSFSIGELLLFLSDELRVSASPTYVEARKRDQKIFVADTRKAEQLLGWSPRVSKHDGVRNLISDLRDRQQ